MSPSSPVSAAPGRPTAASRCTAWRNAPGGPRSWRSRAAPGRQDVRPRRLRHEGRHRGHDGRRRPRHRPRAPARRCRPGLCGGREARQFGHRGGAGVLHGRRGDRHRAEPPPSDARAQGVRLVRGGDRGAGGPWLAPRAGRRRHRQGRALPGRPGGPGPAPRPRTGTPAPGHRDRARLPHPGRRGAVDLPGALPCHPGAPHRSRRERRPRRARADRPAGPTRRRRPRLPVPADARSAQRTVPGRPRGPYRTHPHPHAAQVLGHPPVVRAEPFWTDCALLDRAGIPCLLFGVDGAGAHAADEYAGLASLDGITDVLTGTIADFCA